jgi:predicted esterase
MVGPVSILNCQMKALVTLISSIMLLSTFDISTAQSKAKPREIEIVELHSAPSITSIPWVRGNNLSWQNTKPTFEIGDETFAMKGWLASNDEELLCRIDVRDTEHINLKSDSNIWDGDFLRLAIDGHGDGSGEASTRTNGPFGPDDMTVGFALTPTGPQGWVYKSGDNKVEGKYSLQLIEIKRDENEKITRYIVRVPWSLLHTRPNVYPSFGFVAQVRNIKVEGGRDVTHLRWGEGADELRAGTFQKLSIAPPSHDYVGSSISNAEIWSPLHKAEIALVMATSQNQVIEASAGSKKADITIKGNSQRNIRRFVVRYSPQPNDEAATLKVKVTSPNRKSITEEKTAHIVNPTASATALYNRLDQLVATSVHPLFTRHLQSVKALVQDEMGRLTLYSATNPAKRRETLQYIQSMYAGFNGDAAKWESYLSGKRALFMAFISPYDGKLSYYMLTLPAQWEASKDRQAQPEFPLFVELHGAGNPHLLNGPAAQLGLDETVASLNGYETPKTYSMIDRIGFHIMPHGRGNLGYRGIAESDVWEALDDVSKTFKIDEDRRYLYGFSMGGGGTWLLGTRTPDKWAAIAMFAPSSRNINEQRKIGLGRNVANLPVWLWVGEKDRLWGNTVAIRDELVAHNNKPVFSFTPELGHNYIGTKQVEAHRWLSQFTRKRPNKFSFVVDTDQHLGVWGITATRSLAISSAPSFDCEIEGQTVRINSSGTPALRVNLGVSGLRMEGVVTVVWNGKKFYEGTVTEKVLILEEK